MLGRSKIDPKSVFEVLACQRGGSRGIVFVLKDVGASCLCTAFDTWAGHGHDPSREIRENKHSIDVRGTAADPL